MTGQGMKMEEPLKLMTPFSSGTGMLAMSWAVLQSERSVTEGTMIWQSLSADFKSTLTYDAWLPRPIMQATLLVGLDLVPPKFFGL
jgi:hypothetical protein